MTENTSAEKFPQSRSLNLITQEMGDETLIYDLETNRAFCLNQTSALVWQHSNGSNSVASIALSLSEILRQQVSEQIIRLALDQLNKENLMLAESVALLPASEVSRRKLLRELALSSAVALPIISALVAPEAAQARSCIGFGSFGCQSTQQCCPSPSGYEPVFCNNGQCTAYQLTV